VAVGLYAFHTNGVSHSTAFSAIIATTRNPELDELSRGHSLGAFPLNLEAGPVKLRFGGIRVGCSEEEERASFGIERQDEDLGQKLSMLKRGGKYV